MRLRNVDDGGGVLVAGTMGAVIVIFAVFKAHCEAGW
jgi:hypothetical protein